MKLEEIDKSTLKVGDTVGFQTENYFYNFGYFRYPTTRQNKVVECAKDIYYYLNIE